MDPTRFDALTRLLGGAGERRTVLRALLGTLLGAPLAETAAKPKRRGAAAPGADDTDSSTYLGALL